MDSLLFPQVVSWLEHLQGGELAKYSDLFRQKVRLCERPQII